MSTRGPYAKGIERRRDILDAALRVITEHGRAMTFLVSDGVIPSNEGRGYVLRRLIRRALYMAQTLGIVEPFLVDLAAEVRKHMGDVYPETIDQAALTDTILSQEEERFRRTLDTGHGLLERLIVPRLAGDVAAERVEVSGARALAETIDGILADLPSDAPAVIPGQIGFILYDTSQILHRLPTSMAMSGAIMLFTDVVLLFKHILILLWSSRD